ncbi:deoxyguanosinetriphosphate triphosphohydrolase [Herbaspirillum seropedicae]|uniref:Deoxyguanosinetriphosphate triphosphohydrolase-like protein n=1 Tax=Herbaspirillum seropedicae (strain SmR1) TaxID=757424 RepID=D8ITM5_HERSS|nr:deoxyguanosinetriphosphate triphosphohydrolase [Herbaspirillum seropedicae]ADJ65655.1 deoxyguanosinetriphosphate triphosphohydrolase protein [Herbaspirillum seropedicae SmR1]AKN67472.1 deoxyguanosinetriphosphate triphosphohydrolase [Herbaspirillum seropedicae]AON56533.1 deoxyguanosinetriphosphate triphosphohydrolase [Herbaspirillum seropedicae]NQE32061.1 deoxyguanosinetriphosphate triphosphohydrolase [Herbaspirillum seropedicae]UMU23479.1 deoxyguanosinetriphosphate triphosphohydrolase [Herb
MHTEAPDHLAPYAAHSASSRGRRFSETPPGSRSEFQRDRDRIVHSTAFRRLEYKTQVFVNHEGDLFRTRLTHSIEVAQIARSCARNLQLNEDLVEAISLAHDLGHTPFGHAGQDELNHCMKHHGGFEHNLQSLRVVDELEQHYGAFDGLNLSFETREGILKHCSLHNARQLGEIGLRFLEKKQPSLEAQLANLADEIAYNNHDIDDGLRSGLLTMELMSEVDFFARHLREVEQAYPGITGRRVIHETVRRMINALIVDLIQTSRSRIAEIAPRDIEDVRNAPQLIAFSDPMAAEAAVLKKFLREKLYRHYQVNRMTAKARRIIAEMFEAFVGQPNLLPPDYQVHGIVDDALRSDKQARKVADYIAGMTDRYAIREHRRLFVME